MKYRSDIYKGVFYEKWRTPVTHEWLIWLAAVLQTEDQVHFFFNPCKGSKKNVHVMSIPRYSPYRLTEDLFSYGSAGKYLRDKKKSRRIQPSHTWKLWGTDFVLSVIKSEALSDYREKNKNICQYMIVTADECIEFVGSPPRWEFHRNVKIKTLVADYFKKKKKK